jgi:Ni/Co efflux regulator RcnB
MKKVKVVASVLALAFFVSTLAVAQQEPKKEEKKEEHKEHKGEHKEHKEKKEEKK